MHFRPQIVEIEMFLFPSKIDYFLRGMSGIAIIVNGHEIYGKCSKVSGRIGLDER